MALTAPHPAPPASASTLAAERAERAPAPLSPGHAFLNRTRGLFLLVCAGAVMQLGWVMLWPLSYRLTHGNDFTYTYLTTHGAIWEKLYDLLVLADTLAPGIEPPQTLDLLVTSLVLTFVVASLGYLAGVVLLDHGIARGRGVVAVVLLFEAIAQVWLFLMPGLFTTDIFSYVMYGHIAGIYGLNPYIYPPAYFPGNPMLQWIHPIWHNTPSVYGPLWTDIGWLMAQVITPLTLVERVFAYKLLMNVVHVANLALVWWLTGRLMTSDRARLTAFTAFAWNPLMLFDIAGNAHNDGLMVTLLLVGVVPLAAAVKRRRDTDYATATGLLAADGDNHEPIGKVAWLVGIVSVGLSALVKYTTGLVGLFYVVAWARQMTGWRQRVVWIGTAALLVVAVTLALFWPWLKLPEALDPILNAAGGTLYSNSVPDLAALTIADQILDPRALDPVAIHETVRFWMKVVTRLLFAGYLIWEVRWLWRRVAGATRREVTAAILTVSVRAFLVLLLLVLTWVLEWYYTWPLALAVLLGWDRLLTKVTVGYTLTSLPAIYVHHYWADNTNQTVVLLYAGLPLLLLLAAWIGRTPLGSRLRRRVEPVEPPRARARAMAVRESAGLG